MILRTWTSAATSAPSGRVWSVTSKGGDTGNLKNFRKKRFSPSGCIYDTAHTSMQAPASFSTWRTTKSAL